MAGHKHAWFYSCHMQPTSKIAFHTNHSHVLNGMFQCNAEPVKKRGKNKHRDRVASQDEAKVGTAVEDKPGAPSAADGPHEDPKTEADAEQPTSLPPAEPMDSEPAEAGSEAAALASLPDGGAPAAATAAADTLPTGTAPASEREKKQEGSDRVDAALQAEPAENPCSSAVPVTKAKATISTSKAVRFVLHLMVHQALEAWLSTEHINLSRVTYISIVSQASQFQRNNAVAGLCKTVFCSSRWLSTL